jgi:hypothetical protein
MADSPSPPRRRLSVEERQVLTHLPRARSLDQIAQLSGLPAEHVRQVLSGLVEQGIIKLGARGMPTLSARTLPAARHSPEPAPAPTTPEIVLSEAEVSNTDSGQTPPVEAGAEAQPPESQAPEPTEQVVSDWRALFERQLHPLPEDQRVARARHAEEPELSALCFDPLPAVVKALLENVRLGPVHARLVARHHRNPVGLEALCARAAFTQDVGVRRWLVRNPQLPASLFRRLWAGRRLLEQYLVAQDRDVPESTRRTARELLRTRFNSATAEERVELILKTEGRVLTWLVGMAVDQRTTALLCGRTYRSVLLVQNLARWSSAPPTLVAWLLKQEVVRRQPQLRQLLLRHPNAPTEARRGQQ